MADRITNARLQNAAQHYADCLVAVGVCTDGQVQGLGVYAPYGLCLYVCRYTPDYPGMPLHDVPGFVGSSDGYVTKREAYNALIQSRRALYDALDARNVQRRQDMAGDHARRAAERAQAVTQ